MTENITQAYTPARNPMAALQPEVPQVLHISTPTVVQALSNAFSTSRYSLCLELSAGISLFMSSGGISPDSKSELQSLYVQAGHLAATPDSPEYKSTRRKIGLTALLYQFIGQERLQEVVGGSVELQAIASLASHIEAMGVRTYESVAVMTGRARAMPKTVSTPTEAAPSTAPAVVTEAHKAEEIALQEHIAQEQERVAEYIRAVHEGKEEVVSDFRITPEEEMHGPWSEMYSPRPTHYLPWQDKEDTQHIVLANVNIDVAASCSKEELLKAAFALMELASTMDNTESPTDDLSNTSFGATEPLETPLKAALQEAINKQAKQEEDASDEDEAAIIEHQRIEQERMEAEKKEAKKVTRRVTRR